MTRLVWSRRALSDLARLRDFLMAKNPRAARAAIAIIREAVLRLEQFPAAGRMTAEADPALREWLVPYSTAGYVVLYRLEGDAAVIIAVRHMREGSF